MSDDDVTTSGVAQTAEPTQLPVLGSRDRLLTNQQPPSARHKRAKPDTDSKLRAAAVQRLHLNRLIENGGALASHAARRLISPVGLFNLG